MVCIVKPSEIYLDKTKEDIAAFLAAKDCRIVTFRMVRSRDLVLFYNSGNLSIGIADIKYAGYPRFILESIDDTKIEAFWE